jgi:hypothetical protein
MLGKSMRRRLTIESTRVLRWGLFPNDKLYVFSVKINSYLKLKNNDPKIKF